MKIKINNSLRLMLLASLGTFTTLSSVTEAASYTFSGGNVNATADIEGEASKAVGSLTSEDTLTINITGSPHLFDSSNTTVNAGTINVVNWTLTNGYKNDVYTFTGTITGSGPISYSTWATDAANTYNFTGDMSTYTGNITADSRATGTNGLTLNFQGSARDAASGTGAISLSRTGITYNISSTEDKANTTIQNSSITADSMTLSGTSSYDLYSTVTVQQMTVNSSLNIHGTVETNTLSGAGAVTLKSGSSLNLQQALGSSFTGALTLESGSSMDFHNGTSLNTTIIDTGATFSVDAVFGITALTISDLEQTGAGSLMIDVASSTGFSAGSTYTLLDIGNGADFSLDSFTIDTGAIDSSLYTLNYVDGVLTLEYNGGARSLIWGGGNGLTWNSSDAWTLAGDGSATSYASGDIVSFTGEGNTIRIESIVTPGTITVDTTGEYILANENGGKISGSAGLVKNGSGNLVINGENDFTGGTVLNEGSLYLVSMESLGTGILTMNGGDITVFGGGESSLDGSKFILAEGLDLAFGFDNGSTVSLTSAGSVGNRDVIVSGQGTLKHDSWSHVNSVDIGAAAAVEFTQTNGGSTTAKTITGSGTLIVNNTTEWNFRTQFEAGNLFSGRIELANNGRMIALLDNSADTARVALELGAGSIIVAASQSSGTLYLDELSGSGSFKYNYGASTARHTVNLEMSSDQTFGGTFLHENRMGDLIVKSASDSAQNTLTLSGTGYTQNSTDTTSKRLIINNAAVTLSGEAQWNGVIQLNHDDAKLIFKNTNAAIRSAEAGSISGQGNVVISENKTVSLNGANSYEGTTSVEAGATLHLGNNTAAGSSDIALKAGAALTFESGLTVSNNISLTGVNSFSASTADGVVTLTGNIMANTLTRTSSALNIEQGQFTIKNSDISGVAVTVKDGQSLNLQNVIVNGSTTFMQEGSGTITTSSLTSTGIVVAGSTTKEITTVEGHMQDVTVHTLTGVNLGTGVVDGSTTLTLQIYVANQTAYDALVAAEGITAFELTGIKSLPVWYNNITLEFGNGTNVFSSQALLGYDISVAAGGDVIVYIPEPSTATLSLLALAGLLARRRRKSA